MKTAAILAVFLLEAWLLGGCKTSEKATTEALPTYQCPKCKEIITWEYQGPRFGKLSQHRKKVKTVTHECPSCKKTWGSNLSVVTMCEECQDQHLECPMCRKHG